MVRMAIERQTYPKVRGGTHLLQRLGGGFALVAGDTDDPDKFFIEWADGTDEIGLYLIGIDQSVQTRESVVGRVTVPSGVIGVPPVEVLVTVQYLGRVPQSTTPIEPVV